MERAAALAGEGSERPAMKVELLSAEREPAWDRFVEAHPDAGIYHTRAWRSVTTEAFGHEPLHLCAIDDSGELVGALPLFEVRGLFGRRIVSVPMRDRGGLAAASDEAARALLARARELTEERGAAYLELKGLEPLPEAWRDGVDWPVNRSWVTTQVDLTPGRDAIWSGLNRKSLRWSIKKSAKNGVTIDADASLEGMRTFHELFVRTRCRMGIPPFPWALFEALHRHIVAPGKGELLLAHHEGRAVHGLISFYSKASFVPAYAAPQREVMKLHANELIFWTSIERGIEGGFSRYDFGADSEKQESLLFFKGRWNGVQHPMAWHYYLPGGGKVPDFDSSGKRYELIRAVWRRIPIPLARPLGAWATRQLS
jgi:FemAB-related protein (PEP-CTERM system-associated)